MKDALIKELESLQAQKIEVEKNLRNVMSAQANCITLINKVQGGIETIEKLLKESNEPPKK